MLFRSLKISYFHLDGFYFNLSTSRFIYYFPYRYLDNFLALISHQNLDKTSLSEYIAGASYQRPFRESQGRCQRKSETEQGRAGMVKPNKNTKTTF